MRRELEVGRSPKGRTVFFSAESEPAAAAVVSALLWCGRVAVLGGRWSAVDVAGDGSVGSAPWAKIG